MKGRVKPLHYRAFSLLVAEDKSASEAAKLTGMSVAQVYVVKHRLMLQFKRLVKTLETQKRFP